MSYTEIPQGKDTTLTLVIDNDGAVLNITGYTVKFYLKRRPADSTLLLDKTATLTTPATGICTVTLTSAELASLVGWYHYEVRAIDGSGNRTRCGDVKQIYVSDSLSVPA